MVPEIENKIVQAAEALKAVGAKEIYLFGSAADGTLRDDSDIDIAVRGLPDEVFYRAMGIAGRILDRQVDLVSLDDENPFTQYLETSGELRRVA